MPPTEEAGPGQRRYTNNKFHFSLLYPNTLVVHEYQEQGGALTVVFEDAASGDEFQIYVTPYNGTKITAQRFKLDEPSGVHLDPTAIVVDGAPAEMFFSKNTVMGDTREVWFIHSYLYEVTTDKSLDSWLSHIMQTWHFI
jgi:hypothetical protein